VLCFTRYQTLTNVVPHHALHSVPYGMASGTHPAIDQAFIIARCPEVPPPTATEPTELDPPRAEFGSSRLEPFLPSHQSSRGADRVFKRAPTAEMTRIVRPPPPPPCATASLICSKSSAPCLALALASQPPKPRRQAV